MSKNTKDLLNTYTRGNTALGSISSDVFAALVKKTDPLEKVVQAFIDEGKPGNTIVDFGNKRQIFCGTDYPLGETIVKAKLSGNANASFLRLGKNDKIDAVVYAGGDDEYKCAAITSIDSEGNEIIAQLDELHLLSTREKGEAEIGIITSYTKSSGRVFTGVIKGEPDLSAVKQILASDYDICTGTASENQLGCIEDKDNELYEPSA